MYILTSRLVSLADTPCNKKDRLPLPWYHRAPLGLMSGTHVHVALQKPGKNSRRAFGDLLVSVIDPLHWQSVTEVSVSKEDKPGVLAEMFEHVAPLNIVFAEAVTVDSGSRHDARLIVEPNFSRAAARSPKAVNFKGEIKKLKKRLKKKSKFKRPTDISLHPSHKKPAWMQIGEIRTGWAHVDGWRKAIENQAKAAADADEYDTTMAVVSADTHGRMLRFVFPRKGAVSVSIKHTDKPGAMGEITQALTQSNNKLNILSYLLRRGSAPPGMAEMVVVVEPSDKGEKTKRVKSRVKGALRNLPPSLRVTVEISEAEEAALYPRRPQEVAARPSPALEGAIRVVRDTLPKDMYPIFISRRFARGSGPYAQEALDELHRVLKEKGFCPVEATPQSGAEVAVPDEVKAKMWASKAAIMFVIGLPKKKKLPAFSANLAHECGFVQGQGKPLLPLVQNKAEKAIYSNANLQGLQLSTFTKRDFKTDAHPDSITEVVGPWLEILTNPAPRS